MKVLVTVFVIIAGVQTGNSDIPNLIGWNNQALNGTQATPNGTQSFNREDLLGLVFTNKNNTPALNGTNLNKEALIEVALKNNETKWNTPPLKNRNNTALNTTQKLDKNDLINLILQRNKTRENNAALNGTELNNVALNGTELNNVALNGTKLNKPARNRTHTHHHHTRRPSKLTNRALNNGWNNTSNYTWNYTTHSGDVILGQIGYMDRLLFNKIYFKERRWWSSREKTIEYPKDLPNGYYRHETISAIRIYNKFYDGLNSKAQIVSGGVGNRYVKIRLSSNWGNGFRYLVQIFGR